MEINSESIDVECLIVCYSEHSENFRAPGELSETHGFTKTE